MEIFSPGPVPYPGCYQCPRCNSREVYDSEKTIGVSAMTIDVPGPVNSTIVNVDKIDAKRCRYCNTVAPWLMHPKAKEEFEARKKAKRIRNLKAAGAFMVVVLSIVAINQIVGRVSSAVENKKAANEEKATTIAVNKVYAEWQKASDTCGLNYSVSKDLTGISSGDDIPGVDIYFRDISPIELSVFWETPRGLSLDCFSEKIVGTKISKYFIYPTDQLTKEKDFEDIYLYDETFTDVSVKGVLGKDPHLQGYMAFFKASDGSGTRDSFSISLRWLSKKKESVS